MNTTPDEGLKLASQVVHLAQDESISTFFCYYVRTLYAHRKNKNNIPTKIY